MLAQIVLFLGFVIIIYQDFKERAIDCWTIPWIASCGLFTAVTNFYWEPWFLVFNNLFIAIQLIGVSLYFSIKHQKWINITRDYLGIGDVLIFIAISPLFSPVQFCMFFIGSLIVILFGAGLYHASIQSLKTIPLAGGLGICWMIYALCSAYFKFSMYNDLFLLQFIYE